MSKFVVIGGKRVCGGRVIMLGPESEGFVLSPLKEGEASNARTGTTMDFMDGAEKIIQVIPAAAGTVAIYDTGRITAAGQTEATTKVINYLALTEAGDLRPLILTSNQYFDFADDSEDYLGLHEDSNSGV